MLKGGVGGSCSLEPGVDSVSRVLGVGVFWPMLVLESELATEDGAQGWNVHSGFGLNLGWVKTL